MSITSNNYSGRSGGVENSMLSILFIAGLLGVIYFLRQPGSDLNRDHQKASEMSAFSAESSQSELEGRIKEYLDITGPMEQDVPLRFRIMAYNKQVSYILDPGDGRRKEFKDAEMRHTYKNTGAYRVKLIARYGGGEKLLYAETIYISRNSELAIEF